MWERGWFDLTERAGEPWTASSSAPWVRPRASEPDHAGSPPLQPALSRGFQRRHPEPHLRHHRRVVLQVQQVPRGHSAPGRCPGCGNPGNVSDRHEASYTSKSHTCSTCRTSAAQSGCLLVKPSDRFGRDQLARLWTHESMRVFGDRLTEDDDREWCQPRERMGEHFDLDVVDAFDRLRRRRRPAAAAAAPASRIDYAAPPLLRWYVQGGRGRLRGSAGSVGSEHAHGRVPETSIRTPASPWRWSCSCSPSSTSVASAAS